MHPACGCTALSFHGGPLFEPCLETLSFPPCVVCAQVPGVYVPEGNDIFSGAATLSSVLAQCLRSPLCASVTYVGSEGQQSISAFMKTVAVTFPDEDWTTYTKVCTL